MYNEDQILIIKERKDVKNLTNKIKKVIFPEGFTDIDFEDLIGKNLNVVELPNSLLLIEEYALANNNIENIHLGENLVTLCRGAFQNNKLKNIEIPSNLKVIGPSVFKDNQIETIKLGENTTKISYSAFQNNKIKKVIMNEKLEEIGNCAFCNNEIDEIMFNKNIKKICFGTFDSNRLTKIDLPESIEEIHNDAFASNQIVSLNIPDNVKRIDSGAFKLNKIKTLSIGKGLKTISSRCFYSNNINSLEIPSNIKSIEIAAFMDNEISNLKLNEGLEKIGARAFDLNNLTSVKIPSTVKEIGVGAFNPCDVYVNDIMIEKELVEKYGTELILKIAECKKIVNNINFKNINKEVLTLIPINNDNLKGLNLNINKFNLTYKELQSRLNNKISYETLFKLGYILGAFKGDKLAYESIIKLSLSFDEENLNKIAKQFEISRFDQKFADIINIGIQNSTVNYDRLSYIIPTFYNNIDRIKKGVLKQKENKIAKLNQKINEGNLELREEFDNLKKNKKHISLEEVDNFILTSLFQFSEENKELFKYAHLFNGNIKREDICLIEDIYETAKKAQKSKLKCFQEKIGNYTYSWVENTDPINLVLGYLVNCCAKYKGAGEDIMIQSMINPNLKNLVIYKGDEVVAKSTAYYNDNYILCNNIEVSEAFDKKSNHHEKTLLLYTIVKALKKQAELLNVDEVRVGMTRNDLIRQIFEAKYDIERDNLLPNYKFKNYMGDANDPIFGQAILYKKKSSL